MQLSLPPPLLVGEDREAKVEEQQSEDTKELIPPPRKVKGKGSLDEDSSSDSEGSVVLYDTRM